MPAVMMRRFDGGDPLTGSERRFRPRFPLAPQSVELSFRRVGFLVELVVALVLVVVVLALEFERVFAVLVG